MSKCVGMLKSERGQHRRNIKKGLLKNMSEKNEAMAMQQENSKNLNAAGSWLDTLEQYGLKLTEKQKQEIFEKVNNILQYEPMIGVFGKTGAGKSSLCNALFGQDVCPIDDVAGCTRDTQTVELNMGSNGIKLVDVPGIGENEEQDKHCEELYAELLPKLDMVLWLVKADDRAMAADEAFREKIIRPALADNKPVFLVLTQVDKMEPCREWDLTAHEPSAAQFHNIHRKVALLAGEFNLRSSQVIPVSAEEKYNLTKLVDEMVFALPAEQNLAVYRAVNGEYRSAESERYVKSNMFDVIGEIVSSVCFGASLAVSSIGDALHDWWDEHQPWWWPIW